MAVLNAGSYLIAVQKIWAKYYVKKEGSDSYSCLLKRERCLMTLQEQCSSLSNPISGSNLRAVAFRRSR